MLKKNKLSTLLLFIFILSIPITAFADEVSNINSGDTTFILISTALVFFMIPGVALFYGGMVRKKNVLNTLISVFIIIGIVSIQWVLFGYSLSFGKDYFNFIGGLNYIGLSGVNENPNISYASTIPHSTFMIYQLMFAIITPSLIVGALVERMRFSSFILFISLWTTLVYDPVAHWVWGVNGWLKNLGALDFAGGNVVHITSGIAALVTAIILGKRKGYGTTSILPHNLPLVITGAGILWIGWFGFNAGSALSANGLASTAFMNTHISGASALISWCFIEYIHRKKVTALGAITGGIAGLVAITPAAGFVTPISSIIIGVSVSPLCYISISKLKSKFNYDDSLDAFGCHGIGGMWGAVATGIFSNKSINPAGADGLIYGNPHQLIIQFISVIVTIIFSAIVTYLILKFINILLPLRVNEEDEINGLDLSLHGEDAYHSF